MAQPITWQNVTGPAMGDPTRFMGMAQQGIDGAFDKLQGVLKQRETTDAANYEQGGVNNAEAFKSALYGITTPEQMAAAQKSGQFNNMLAGYGANVKDPSALRGLMDGRLGVLQGQATAAGVYDDSQATRTQRPLVNQIGVLTANGDTAGANALIGAHPELLNSGALAQGVKTNARQMITDTQTAAKSASELLTGANTREHMSAQTKVLNSQATDTLLNRTIGNRIATSGLETATKIGEAQSKFGVLAASLGMPVSRGFVDTDTLTKEQKAKLDAAGDKAGMGTFSGIPTMSSAFRSISGDLAKESPDAARVIAAGQDAYLGQFKASGITTEYGAFTDRMEKALALAKSRNVYNDDKGKPLLDSASMADELTKFIKESVPEGNREGMNTAVTRHIAKGFKQPDGTVIPYPLDGIKESIKEANKPWWFNFAGLRDAEGDVTTRLNDWMKIPKNQDRLVEGLGALSGGERELFTDKLFPKGSDGKPSGGKGSSSPMRSGTPPGYKSPVTTVKNPTR